MNGDSAGCPSPGPGSASKAKSGGANSRTAVPATSPSDTNSIAPTKDKRLKRLERNRESARLSRRRRKQYLEELEVRVTSMSEEMDRGRIQHASAAVRTLRGMRLQKLMEVERLVFGSGGVGGSAGLSNSASEVFGYGIPGGNGFYDGMCDGHSEQRIMGNSKVGVNNPLAYENYEDGNDNGNSSNQSNNVITHHSRNYPKPRPASTISAISKPLLEQHLRPLHTNLSRTNNELQIVNLFLKQQLMSMVQPNVTKLVLWLTLQKEGFYRGGRAQSERLSAARIGERVSYT